MFNGLIREIAKVKSFQDNILNLSCSYKPQIGDSIAVNGMCLTVIELDSMGFSLEVSKHSQSMVAIENLANYVHIEPALLANSRLDGHFVQGHIDAIGVIKSITKQENQTLFEILAPSQTLNLIIPQGSITIDGVSLTISSVGDKSFTLTIIPHTFANTLFHTYKPKRRVNIETDVLVRTIAHILSKRKDFEAQDNLQKSWGKFDALTLQY